MTQVPSKQPFQTVQGSIIVIHNLSGLYQRTKQYYYGRNVTASPEISPWNQEISQRVKSVNTCWNSLSGNGSKTELKMVPSQQDSRPLSRTSEVTKCQNVQGHLGHMRLYSFMKSSLNGSPRHLPMPVWVLYGSINFKDTRIRANAEPSPLPLQVVTYWIVLHWFLWQELRAIAWGLVRSPKKTCHGCRKSEYQSIKVDFLLNPVTSSWQLQVPWQGVTGVTRVR